MRIFLKTAEAAEDEIIIKSFSKELDSLGSIQQIQQIFDWIKSIGAYIEHRPALAKVLVSKFGEPVFFETLTKKLSGPFMELIIPLIERVVATEIGGIAIAVFSQLLGPVVWALDVALIAQLAWSGLEWLAKKYPNSPGGRFVHAVDSGAEKQLTEVGAWLAGVNMGEVDKINELSDPNNQINKKYIGQMTLMFSQGTDRKTVWETIKSQIDKDITNPQAQNIAKGVAAQSIALREVKAKNITKNDAMTSQLGKEFSVAPDKVMETLRAQLLTLKSQSDQAEYNELMDSVRQKNPQLYQDLTQQTT